MFGKSGRLLFLAAMPLLGLGVGVGIGATPGPVRPALAKPAPALAKSPLALWADGVSAANRQRYCDASLSADELLARLDSAPPDSYRSADVVLGLPADFREHRIPASASKYLELSRKIVSLHGLSGYGDGFYLNHADRIRIILVGPGCALRNSSDLGLERNYLGDQPNLKNFLNSSGLSGVDYRLVDEEKAKFLSLFDTKFAVRQPASDDIIMAGVYAKEYMPADYWVMFVTGLSRPFTLDAIAWWAGKMTESQNRKEAFNANLAKTFPLKVPTAGVATDIDSYQQLLAKAYGKPAPGTKRSVHGYSSSSGEELIKAEALAAMLEISRSRGLPITERSHLCVTPKASCKLGGWTPVGDTCTCEYVSGHGLAASLNGPVAMAVMDVANGRVVSEPGS